MRESNWRLASLPDGKWELFDLATDRSESKDLEKALATRALDAAPTAEARRFLEAALADPDLFVREAARQWLRRRLPPGQAASLGDPSSTAWTWERVARAPRQQEPLTSVAATVRGGGTVADRRREMDPDWAQGALHERRLPPELPGARTLVLSSGKWRGRPRIVRVPDGYRGDEPMPLLIYLSGGPGHSLLGRATAEEALAPTGHHAVFPQASGTWWSDESRELVRLLLDEILDRYDVDTSRLPLLFVHGDGDRVIDADASRDSVMALRRENRDAGVELQMLLVRPGRP